MIDLDKLSSDIPQTGLVLGSPDLDEMRALAEDNNYDSLGLLAEKLIDQSIWDIRILIYSAYADMRNEGLLGMPRLLVWMTTLLSDKWQGVGPEVKRDVYAKSSLAWLFTVLRVDFQTAELESGDVWRSWISGFSLQDLDSSLDALNVLSHQIRQCLGEELAGDPNGKLTELSNWLKGISQKLPRPVDMEARNEEVEGQVQQTLQVEQSTSKQVNTSFEGSLHLDLLTRKLSLFEAVITSGDMVKSAVVAADIMDTIEHFDPRIYLPSLFARYFSLLVPNIDEINELFSMRDSPQFQALHSLYQVDMDAFLTIDLQSRFQ